MTQSVHLLVDIGNSRIKWNVPPNKAGNFDKATRAFAWSPHMLSHLLDQHWGALESNVSTISVSNVAGAEVQRELMQWCHTNWSIEPDFLATTASFGDINNGYDDYRELGVDRWLAIIAAHYLYPESGNIIIDCGSAITVDTVLPDGSHLAGPVIPGNDALKETLLSRFSLQHSELQAGVADLQVFVKNTKNALLNGVSFAASGGLVALVKQSLASLDSSLLTKIIVTGGAAQEMLPLSTLSLAEPATTGQGNPFDYIHEPDLVLKGIHIYLEHSQ